KAARPPDQATSHPEIQHREIHNGPSKGDRRMTRAPSNQNEMTLTANQHDTYLAKIVVSRPISLDLQGLSRLHRAHLMTFTWEALDAFMEWPSSITPRSAFAKMVEGRRGGWCY